MRLVRGRLVRLVTAAPLVASLVACGIGAASPPASCPSEPRAPGTLPDLEARLPSDLSNVTIDSGWNCLPASLRTYARHGVSRLEFAGATADEGGGSGTVIAVLRSGPGDPPLQAQWAEEFYEGSARESGRVDNIVTRRETIGTAGEVWRLDALNGLSLQSIVVWPADSVVRVVIVASDVGPNAERAEHDARVLAAVATAAAAPGPSAAPRSSGPDGPSVLPSGA